MIKYILVLVLFGFFNVSLAHDGEEENWMSCVMGGFCKEINLDHVVKIIYNWGKGEVYFFRHATKEIDHPFDIHNGLIKFDECTTRHVWIGKRCFAESVEKKLTPSSSEE